MPVTGIQDQSTMDKYYYLIASLPLLKFAETPLMTGKGFIDEAGKWACGEDFIILTRADINNVSPDSKDTPVLRNYKDFEYSARTQLAVYRQARRQGGEYKISKDLLNIIQEGRNPLDVEIKLLRLKWDFLQGQEIEHFFDLDFLIIYYLKLQILERLAGFNKEKGKQKLEAYSSV